MKIRLLSLIVISVFAVSADAQGLGQVADKTFGYVKARAFGKPDVIKKTSKVSIGQVRVHYKTVSSRDKKQDRDLPMSQRIWTAMLPIKICKA